MLSRVCLLADYYALVSVVLLGMSICCLLCVLFDRLKSIYFYMVDDVANFDIASDVLIYLMVLPGHTNICSFHCSLSSYQTLY